MIVSISVAIAVGMPVDKAVASIEKGIGSTMGVLVPVLGFGAMLGKMVSESGAAQRITSRLVSNSGDQKYTDFPDAGRIYYWNRTLL